MEATVLLCFEMSSFKTQFPWQIPHSGRETPQWQRETRVGPGGCWAAVPAVGGPGGEGPQPGSLLGGTDSEMPPAPLPRH